MYLGAMLVGRVAINPSTIYCELSWDYIHRAVFLVGERIGCGLFKPPKGLTVC